MSGAASGSGAPKLHIVKKLTEQLLTTYKDINKKYYEKKKKKQAEAKHKSGDRNATYDYRIKLHEKLDERYRVLESIGKGSFGQVVKAFDERESKPVAIKIIKNKEAFRIQAKSEMDLLKLLNRHDPGDQWSIVRMKHTFMHHGHTCIVFELLSINLYQLLRRTSFQGVSLNLVRKFARQILKTLAYLSLEDVNVIHCDLKPENILFVQPNRSAIKVIDFGSSCRANAPMYTYIQSRFYRSPEVILGLPYNTAIDMWSLGCILVEMHTGSPLFSGRDQQDQMARFVSLLGLPPKHMLDRGRKTHHYFEFTRVAHGDSDSGSDSDSSMDSAGSHSSDSDSSCGSSHFNSSAVSDLSDSDSSPDDGKASQAGASKASGSKATSTSRRRRRRRRHASRSRSRSRSRSKSQGTGHRRRIPERPSFHEFYRLKKFVRQGTSPVHTSLAKVLGVNTGGPGGRRTHEPTGHSLVHYRHFLDLVLQMLEFDPARRIKPMQALNHPFLREDMRNGAARTAATDASKAKATPGSGSGSGTPAAAAAAAAGAGAGAGSGSGAGTGAAAPSAPSAAAPAADNAPTGAGGNKPADADADMAPVEDAGSAAVAPGVIAYLNAGGTGGGTLSFQPPGKHDAAGPQGVFQLVPLPAGGSSGTAVSITALPQGVSLPKGVVLPAGVTPVVLPAVLTAGMVVALGPVTVGGKPKHYCLQSAGGSGGSGAAPGAASALASASGGTGASTVP